MKNTGVAVKVITGDNIMTASSVARATNILTENGQSVVASDMDPNQIYDVVARAGPG